MGLQLDIVKSLGVLLRNVILIRLSYLQNHYYYGAKRKTRLFWLMLEIPSSQLVSLRASDHIAVYYVHSLFQNIFCIVFSIKREASSGKPLRYFITVSCICLTCQSLIGNILVFWVNIHIILVKQTYIHKPFLVQLW
jgi:hypothetical protein